MTNSTRTSNRLSKEKSPYLLQHAYNPVDWYPWGEEAFTKAKKEDKPIFLSIGYSTCHWCHVMERESFEDQEVADLLNEHYISIKVDREERPDVDTIYMSVCQAMTGHGGWPLTVVMTPDKKPFFAGTYYPKQSNRGMPGIMDILSQINLLWATSKTELINSGENMTRTLEASFFTHAAGEISRDVLDEAYAYFAKTFDAKFGGFGRAPKFPSPHNMSFLLRYWKMTGEINALAMVEKTLEAMYRGGIYDHIGFGFARYSTDQKWLAPHFEKMLYDNALLAIAYLEAYQATEKDFYAQAAREIFSYVLRDMTSTEGAFYSAEDADSEGEEGKFYIWSPEEIRIILGDQDGDFFCRAYDITDQGNFEGKNIPNLINAGLVQGLAAQKQKVFTARKKRIPPFKDDKILTAWNGLMIAALAMGSRVLRDRSYASAAGNAVQFIMSKLLNQEGRLLARYRDDQAAHLAYVDDYAFLIWGLIELYETTFIPDYLAMALQLNQEMLKYFWDEEKGGLFQYGWDAEKLITRPKEIYDGAMPSGNSVAAVNFLRLAGLTGNPELEKVAEEQLNSFGGSIAAAPAGHVHFLMAVCLRETAFKEVTIIGDPADPQTESMVNSASKGFNPNLLFTVKFSGLEGKKLEKIIPQVAQRKAIGGKVTAYVCSDFTCYPPVTEPRELEKLLGKEPIKV